jgi:hypothetical protein
MVESHGLVDARGRSTRSMRVGSIGTWHGQGHGSKWGRDFVARAGVGWTACLTQTVRGLAGPFDRPIDPLVNIIYIY